MHHTVEQAKAYLDARLGERGPDSARVIATGGPYITISRESGSGGTKLGQLLAARLSEIRAKGPRWTVYDQDIVERMLQSQQLSPDLAKYLPESKVWELDSLVREIVGLHPNLWTLVQQTNALIQRLAKSGRAIVVGRGARFATTDVARGLHIRLVATPSHRAAQIAAQRNISVAQAIVHNRRVDEERAAYVRSVFQADVADSTAYDLVFNTGTVSLATIVEVTAAVVPATAPTR